MNAPLISVEDLAVNARKLEQSEVALREVARVAQQDLARIAIEMAETERLLSRKDEMLGALNLLAMKAGEKNKGLFEDLLTDLIQEVMDGKEDKVVLTSAMKNNRASLDFDILVDGELENIDEDKGGSISNIVAMGLRFIVLARHPNRRVLLLDEADCSLNKKYITAFAAVMRQLAVKMGIQVVYISHHEPEHFIGYGRVIEVSKVSGRTHAKTMHAESDEDRDIESMSAFRYIRLRDYGPHENLLVELSPGLNIIVGDNDMGKSKIIQAVADLLDNDGNERRIRHKRPFFNVELGLEESMSLHWEYQRKGSKRTKMQLKDIDGKVIESSEQGSGVPAWLDTYLSMPRINGENIHFHSQKRPNYLLSSQDFTSIKRAEMLPLGRESRDVHRMIQLFNAKIAGARQDHALQSKQLNAVKNTLAILSPVLDDPLDLDDLQIGVDGVRGLSSRLTSLVNCSKNLSKLQSLNNQFLTMIEGLSKEAVPEVGLKSTQQMSAVIERLEQCTQHSSALARLTEVQKSPVEPVVRDTLAIATTATRLQKIAALNEMMDKLSGLDQAPEVMVRETAPIKNASDSIERHSLRLNETQLKLVQCGEKSKGLALMKIDLYNKMGGVCPTCDRALEGHTHE